MLITVRAQMLALICLILLASLAVPFAMAQGGERVVNEIPSSLLWAPDPQNVGELAQQSEVILIGVMHRTTRTRRITGTEYVETIMRCRVEEVLKGDLPSGAFVSVGRPGGVLREPGGVVESRVPSDDRPLIAGYRYALFLTKETSRPGYSIAGGLRGVFELRDRIIVYDRRRPEGVWMTLDRMPVDRFMERLRGISGAGNTK